MANRTEYKNAVPSTVRALSRLIYSGSTKKDKLGQVVLGNNGKKRIEK